MNKRIVVAFAAVAAVVAVVWLTTRGAEPQAADQSTSATSKRLATPVPSESVKDLPDPLPIEVSPGFEFLSKPATEMQDTDGRWLEWRRHQELQSEPRDEAWAPRMEAALRSGIEDALTERGFDTQRIELPVVECRTTGCEIQALGYPGDNTKNVGDSTKNGADLELILPSLFDFNLGREFDMDGSSMAKSSRQDQRTTIFVQLTRRLNYPASG